MIFESGAERLRRMRSATRVYSGISERMRPSFSAEFGSKFEGWISGLRQFICNWKGRETFVLVARESLAFVLSYNFIISSILGRNIYQNNRKIATTVKAWGDWSVWYDDYLFIRDFKTFHKILGTTFRE